MLCAVEQERLHQMTQTERAFWARGIRPAGMDEVGRGPLRGPWCRRASSSHRSRSSNTSTISKNFPAARREKLYPIIKQSAVACGSGWVWQDEIDEINILNATKKAFCMAYAEVLTDCTHVLVDALEGLNISAAQHPIVHGDALSYLIAAASILAKVERDAYMVRMHEIYPQYGSARNKGYGTAEHIAAIREYGLCPLHRKSFIKGITEEPL